MFLKSLLSFFAAAVCLYSAATEIVSYALTQVNRYTAHAQHGVWVQSQHLVRARQRTDGSIAQEVARRGKMANQGSSDTGGGTGRASTQQLMV